MTNNFLSVIVFFIYFNFTSFAQPNSEEVSILFYNVENLFDFADNALTDDDSFTAQGDLHWTEKRLKDKLLKISKVILNASEWNVPDVVAMCEIENRQVLEKLIKDTPLKSIPYKIIHKESPDHRGIDVAFLYNSDHFYPLEYKHYPLQRDENSEIKTREILYVSGVMNGIDTLHFFVNHWPSRYSGILETRQLRNSAAELLSTKVKALNQKFVSPKIVILGDFNDNPSDESISNILKAKQVEEKISAEELYNLSADWLKADEGTLKFQSQWFVFDQIIVSGTLLNATSGLVVAPGNAKIINLPFLMEKDEKYGGLKPFRTYYGFSYNAGFSDHLPVLLKLGMVN